MELDINVFLRDYNVDISKLELLYGYRPHEMNQSHTIEENIDIAYNHTMDFLKTSGYSNEATFFQDTSCGYSEIAKDLDSAHKQHVIMETYIFLKRTLSDSQSLTSYLGDMEISINTEIGNYSKLLGNNIFGSCFRIEKSKSKQPGRTIYKCQDSFHELFSYFCHHPQMKPFKDTVISKCKYGDPAMRKIIDFINDNKEVIDTFKMKCNAFVSSITDYLSSNGKPSLVRQHSLNIENYYIQSKGTFKELSDIIENSGIKRMAKDKFKDYFISCKTIYHASISCNKRKKDKQLYEFLNEFYNREIRRGYIDIKSSDSLKTIARKYMGDISIEDESSFIENYFSNIKLPDKGFSWLKKRDCNPKTAYECKILPSMIFVFCTPDIFVRKYYIDLILTMYKEKYIFHDRFHNRDEKIFSPDQRSYFEIGQFIKNFTLCMSLSYIPMQELFFYQELLHYEEKLVAQSQNDQDPQKKMLNDLEKYIEENKNLFMIKDELEIPLTRKENEMVSKIYDYMRIHVFNSIKMARWKQLLDIDYLSAKMPFKKLIVSMTEYEKAQMMIRTVETTYFPPSPSSHII